MGCLAFLVSQGTCSSSDTPPRANSCPCRRPGSLSTIDCGTKRLHVSLSVDVLCHPEGGVMGKLALSSNGRLEMSRSGLHRATRRGQLDRIARGIYLPTDAPAADWNWIEAAARRPDATICLTSALAYHDLIDSIPSTLDIAIPRGSRIPATESAIFWHSFDRASFPLGRDEILIPGTSKLIGLYSAERSIADAFRLRGELGYETARDALKEWLRRGGKPASLLEYAMRLPRASTPLLRALDALA
jgi:hypothetical protein